MSVKTIFKTLIGTIVIIVMSSVIIELFNINTSGVMINQYLQLSAYNSCVLFTQETFRRGTSGAINNTEILASDGSSYSGDGAGTGGGFHNFYNGSTAAAIWEDIYIKDTDFKQQFYSNMSASGSVYSATQNALSVYKNGGDVKERVPELESLKIMAENSGVKQTVTPPSNLWDLSEDSPEYIDYINKTRANTYIENMYTPVNLGIPYINKTVASRMFKWNLTQLLSNCNSGNILSDDNGEYYVNFKGFAVYTKYAEITKVTYHVCDLNTADGKQKLKDMTGIDAAGLNYKTIDPDTSPKHEKISNNLVYVAEVDYTVPVSYRGITPIKEIFNYFMNRDSDVVIGYDDTKTARTAQEFKVERGTASTDPANIGYNVMESGKAFENSKLSIGKLYYTLVR